MNPIKTRLLDEIQRQMCELRAQGRSPTHIRMYPSDWKIISGSESVGEATLWGLLVEITFSQCPGSPHVYNAGKQTEAEVIFRGGPLGGERRAFPSPPPRRIDVPAVRNLATLVGSMDVRSDITYDIESYDLYTYIDGHYEALWVNPNAALRKELDELKKVYVQVKFVESLVGSGLGHYKAYTYEDPWKDLKVGELVEVNAAGTNKPAIVTALGSGLDMTGSKKWRIKKVLARYTKESA